MNEEMKQHLQQELAFLEGMGETPNQVSWESLKSHLPFAKEKGTKTLLLQFLKEGVALVTEEFLAPLTLPSTTLAFRGSLAQQYSFSQEISEGRKLFFSVLPHMDRSEVFLSLRVSPGIPLRAKLNLDGSVVEHVDSLQEEQWFDTKLSPYQGAPEIILLENQKEIGRIQLLLQGFAKSVEDKP